jgi:C4-dicarboxylate transporter DctM subunit
LLTNPLVWTAFGASLIALLALGVPVAFAMGVCAIGLLYFASNVPLTIAVVQAFSTLDSYVLVSIPFFMLSGQILNLPSTGAVLEEFVSSISRRFRGAPAFGAVLTCLFFGGITGSSAAEAAAVSKTVLPTLNRIGYPREFSAAILATASTLGILIPPSITMIIFGAVAEVSVPRLFLAGVIPGFIGAAVMAGYAVYRARQLPVHQEQVAPAAESVPGGPRRLPLFIRMLPILGMPVILMGGIYSGIFTATESAAVLVVYATFVAIFIYRDRNPADLAHALRDCFIGTMTIYALVMGASLFGFSATFLGLPQIIVRTIQDLNLSAWQFLLALNIIMLIAGMFIDGLSLLLIVLPVVLPTARALNIDLFHLAVVMTVNIEIAVLTPPVGLNLFVLSKAAEVPLERLIRAIFPFIILMLCLLVLFTYVPIFSTWLPRAVTF